MNTMASSLTISMYKLDLWSHKTIKRASSSIPFNNKTRHFSFQFLISNTASRFSLPNCKFSISNSLVDDCLVNGDAQKNTPQIEVKTSMWNWRGYSIRYQYSGSSGPAMVLVHGFGANSDHWRKNIAVLAEGHRVYSIDLIGYGYSDKPNPRELGLNSLYTFETWASQLNDFCTDVVKDQAFFICNSIGVVLVFVVLIGPEDGHLYAQPHTSILGPEDGHLYAQPHTSILAAVMKPEICRGIFLLNISLRMLHIKKQPWYGRPLIKSFQSLLRNTGVGKFFFKAVATPDSVRNILCQCYNDTSQVTDELVDIILRPGLEPGAADVFLEFICYSGGPLPEELLPQVKCPVLVAWGERDPWEPIDLGRACAEFDSVEDFVVLPNVGHCPQDEAPHLVNPLVVSFVARHVARSASLSSAAF